MRTQLEDLWAEMAATPAPSGLLKRLLSPDWVGELSAALTKPDNTPSLLLELSEPLKLDTDSIATSEGIQLVTTGRDGGTIAIQLSLTDSKYSDTFLTLADDLATKILRTTSERDGALSLVHNLNRWFRFLKKRGSGVLSREQRTGLYGELATLQDVLAPSVGYPAAIRAWVGPTGSYQDFQFGTVAIEVKTLSATQPQQLKIETERQLDDRGLAALVLAHNKVDIRQGTGRTLPALIEEIRAMVEGTGTAGEFEDLLFEAGYLDAHSHHYGNDGYLDRGSAMYRVAQGFPRIVEDDLMPGVGRVRYQIDASACIPYSVAQEQVLVWIGEGPPMEDPTSMQESQHLEFKQSGWVSSNPDVPAKVINAELVKTVAGFLNSTGGTLIIGVVDRDGSVTGIEPDLQHLKTDIDGYENRLTTLFREALGSGATSRSEIAFESRGELTICLVRVKPSPRPVWAKPPDRKNDQVFWIRLNNSTRELSGSEMVEFIRDHWG